MTTQSLSRSPRTRMALALVAAGVVGGASVTDTTRAHALEMINAI